MRDQPVTSRFLKVVNHSIISGTIPRDTETRPHVQVSNDDSALRGQYDPDAKPIGIIGSAKNGIPNHVYAIKSLRQAQEIFGGGPLLDGIECAWQPGFQAYGMGGIIYAERVENAGQATLNAGALGFMSTIYGKDANNLEVQMEKDPLTKTWTIQVMDKQLDYHATYSGLGLLAFIQYHPNAWDKWHIPAGQKDYTRASIEVVPKATKIHDSEGKVHYIETGKAAKLIFHIHDTKQPGILRNNITNNVNGGSTVYNENGTESQVSQNANQGDLNPDRGPFEDWTFSVDLTNPKFAGIEDLFNYLQNLPNIDLGVNDEDHDISHIQSEMLDLTQHPIDITPNINETTQDSQGNIIEPGTIWSTLGDIVDKLRYDKYVHASADMNKQLNIISTSPDNTKTFTSDASAEVAKAKSAETQANINNMATQSANADNAPELANEYASAASSYAKIENSYESLAQAFNSDAASLANSETSNTAANDPKASKALDSADKAAHADQKSIADLAAKADDQSKSAAAFNNTAKGIINRNSASVASYRKSASNYTSSAKATNNATQASQYRSMARSANHSAVELDKPADQNIAKAKAAMANRANFIKAEDKPKNDLKAQAQAMKAARADIAQAKTAAYNQDMKGNYPDNMRKVQIYANNLINQTKQALTDHLNNIVNSDLNELSNIAERLVTPSETLDSKMFKVGQAMNADIQRALANLRRIKDNEKGAAAKFNRSLDAAKVDINDADPSKEAPHDIFTSNIGDGQINVLGEPINAFSYTNLTGGYTKPVPVSWSSKFHYFDDCPVYDMVVLTPSASIHSELAAYIADRYNASHNMRGFVGGGYAESVQQLIQRSADLDNERMYLIGTSGHYTMEDGRNEDLPAFMVAAIIAGIDSSIAVGDSILNKQVYLNNIDREFSSVELDTLDQNGIIMANPVINRGVSSEFVVSDDVSTNNDLSDPVKAELQLGEVTDFLFDDLRQYLQQYIGSPVNITSSQLLKDAVNNFLEREKATASGGDGMIVDYKPDDTYCEIHNESAYIEFSVAPTRTLKYINVIGSYLGFDESSGGNSDVPFEFIDKNGQISEDDTSMDDSSSDSDNDYQSLD